MLEFEQVSKRASLTSVSKTKGTMVRFFSFALLSSILLVGFAEAQKGAPAGSGRAMAAISGTLVILRLTRSMLLIFLNWRSHGPLTPLISGRPQNIDFSQPH